MKAYTTSTATLKTLLAHPSLQRDHIDATMESMADTLADHAEIEEAIQLGGQSVRTSAGVEDVDETELEAELDELVKLKQMEDLAKAQAEKEQAAKDKAERERKEREADRERTRLEELGKVPSPARPSTINQKPIQTAEKSPIMNLRS